MCGVGGWQGANWRASAALNPAWTLIPPHLHFCHPAQSYHSSVLPTGALCCSDPFAPNAAVLPQSSHSVILTSGTLSPLDSFASELGTDFKVQLEAPHVVDMAKQVGEE